MGALHIVSAQLSELGLTFGQEAVEDKSNEIPAVQRLIKMLRLKDCVVVADALNCQKDTAAAIIGQGADYLLSAYVGGVRHPGADRLDTSGGEIGHIEAGELDTAGGKVGH